MIHCARLKEGGRDNKVGDQVTDQLNELVHKEKAFVKTFF